MPTDKQGLIDLLSEPKGFHSQRWPEVAASRKALHVRVSMLRSEGRRIISEPDYDFGTPAPPVVYRLIA